MAKCGRITKTGSGTVVECEKPEGHIGAHLQTWIDRDGNRQTLLSWTHENSQGQALWPATRGAVKITA